MANLVAPITIPATDCIGNSLATINNNFSTLFSDIQEALASVQQLPSVAKAWVYNDPDGFILSQYNISTVTPVNVKPATGNIGAWKYEFTTPLPSDYYCIVASASDNYHSPGTIFSVSVASQSKTGFTLICDAEAAIKKTYPNGVPTNIYAVIYSN